MIIDKTIVVGPLCNAAADYYVFEQNPKAILNSLDYVVNNKGKRSNKIRWKCSLARFTKRGDAIHSVFTK